MLGSQVEMLQHIAQFLAIDPLVVVVCATGTIVAVIEVVVPVVVIEALSVVMVT